MSRCDDCSETYNVSRDGLHVCERVELEQARLTAAIRRFTVEMPDDEPNGPAQALALDLAAAFDCDDMRNAHRFFKRFCEALDADVQELREAAESYFGGDFRSPQQMPQENGPRAAAEPGGESRRDRAPTSGGVVKEVSTPATAQREAVAAGQPGEPPPQGLELRVNGSLVPGSPQLVCAGCDAPITMQQAFNGPPLCDDCRRLYFPWPGR